VGSTKHTIPEYWCTAYETIPNANVNFAFGEKGAQHCKMNPERARVTRDGKQGEKDPANHGVQKEKTTGKGVPLGRRRRKKKQQRRGSTDI